MAQDRNEQGQMGGPYLIQDTDHMVVQQGGQTKRGKSRQADQSQAEARQQGAQHETTTQQGGGKRKSR